MEYLSGPTSIRARTASLLFCSGMCALVYQVAWTRELRLVFGASTAASAAVLAVFMGGLGLGGALFGGRADRHRNALALYASLEIGVSLLAAASPFLVKLARALYVALGGTSALGAPVATATRLLLAVLVLGGPTLLMGGTLPAAARAVETDADGGRTQLAVLYGANTLGAVLGAALSNFLLLEVMGTRLTLWLACLVNLLVGVVARSMARAQPDERAAAIEALHASRALRAPDATRAPLATSLADAPASSPAPRAVVMAAAALVGFAFLLMELVWYRMLAPILGGSSYTFGLVLAVALSGIGAGSALYATRRDGARSPTIAAFALTCALEALFLALPFALGDRVALLAHAGRALASFGFGGLVVGWTVVTAIVVLPAAVVAGYQFPQLIALLGEGRASVGRDVGQAYLANTLGAIVGSLAGGFGLLPALSAPGCWRLAVALLATFALVAVALELRKARGAPRLLPIAGLAAVACAAMLARGPTALWRHGAIGAGRSSLPLGSALAARFKVENDTNAALLWEVEGVESSVALLDAVALQFVVNGKTDGGTDAEDLPTEIFAGLLGAALHPAPKRALVVGLGTGATAGWLGVVPGMERVDAVELEPAIAHVAAECAPINQHVLEQANVRLSFGDAREVLLTTKERYDLVVSEPSNPYRAGIAGLFTRDFYLAAERRLAPSGIFLQWVQSYEVDGHDVAGALATLHSVFPVVSVWVTADTDFILVASREPIAIDEAALRARLAGPPYREAMIRSWGYEGLEGLLAHHAANPELVARLSAAYGDDLNTDDRNPLEFAVARTAGRQGELVARELWADSRALRTDRPRDLRGEVDWSLVEYRRALSFPAVARPEAMSPAQNHRLSLVTRHRAGERGEGLAKQLGPELGELSALAELEMACDALSARGDRAALPLIERLREWQPVEALIYGAQLHASNGRMADATGALEAAFVVYRTDPWAHADVVGQGLDLAGELAALAPDAAARLEIALGQPFSAHQLNWRRRRVRVELTMRLADVTRCVSALGDFEPWPPWDGAFLAARDACYRRAGSPLSARASADLEAFEAMSPTPMVVRR